MDMQKPIMTGPKPMPPKGSHGSGKGGNAPKAPGK